MAELLQIEGELQRTTCSTTGRSDWAVCHYDVYDPTTDAYLSDLFDGALAQLGARVRVTVEVLPASEEA